MPELTVQYSRHQRYPVFIVENTAEIILFYDYCMDGTIPETFTAIDATVFDKPCLAVTYAKGPGRANPHTEGAAGTHVLTNGKCMVKKALLIIVRCHRY